MVLCGVEKKKEQACSESKRLSPNSEDLVNKVQGIAIKPDCTNESRIKVAQAIESNNLCLNCETGFHYMKQ